MCVCEYCDCVSLCVCAHTHACMRVCVLCVCVSVSTRMHVCGVCVSCVQCMNKVYMFNNIKLVTECIVCVCVFQDESKISIILIVDFIAGCSAVSKILTFRSSSGFCLQRQNSAPLDSQCVSELLCATY